MRIAISGIIRTKRKTIALVINADAKLIVRAPLSVPKEYINELVERKRAWIERKQQEIVSRNETYAQKQYVNGEDCLFLGDVYRLAYSDNVSSIVLKSDRLLLPDQKCNAQKLIIEWYRDEAQRVFKERTAYYASMIGVKYRSVRISSAARRWGSCGVKGTLNFSWRLIMAPLRVIDSVVVHELVHIEFRNHSKKFWARVRTIMPDYDQQRKWLKEHQKLLEIM